MSFLSRLFGAKPAPSPDVTVDEPEADLHALLDALRSPEGGIREAIAFVQRGEAGIPVLLEAITETQPRVRGLACFALGQIKIPSDDVVRALRLRLDDEDHEVRATAARSLESLEAGSAGTPSSSLHSVDELLLSLGDADQQMREEAVDSIGRLGEQLEADKQDAVLTALVDHLLHDPYFQVRSSAALAIWRIGQAPVPVIAALSKALGDGHLIVQAMAAQVLGNFGPRATSALPALTALAAGGSGPELAEQAQKAIKRIAP
jgi:HEAT repeat protein